MAKDMNYEKFINEVPKETKDIVIQAIKIYNGLKNETLICNKYSILSNVKKVELNDNEVYKDKDVKIIQFPFGSK